MAVARGLVFPFCTMIAWFAVGSTHGGQEALYGQLLGSNDLVNQRVMGEIHL